MNVIFTHVATPNFRDGGEEQSYPGFIKYSWKCLLSSTTTATLHPFSYQMLASLPHFPSQRPRTYNPLLPRDILKIVSSHDIRLKIQDT